MFSFWPVYKREVKTFFQSPGTWVVMALLLFVMGIIFFLEIKNFVMMSDQARQYGMFGQSMPAPNINDTIRGVFQVLSSLIMFMIPMLAMRLVSEEKSRGTFELLVTCPIGDWAILIGKYFALLTVGLAVILISIVYPAGIWYFGHGQGVLPDWPVVASCWIGLLLIFATYSAFGLMASSFTENQVIAAVITLIGIILWYLIGAFGTQSSDVSPQFQAIIKEICASEHIDNFTKGVLMLKDVAFYLLASFLFLFIASKTLDARRWRV